MALIFKVKQGTAAPAAGALKSGEFGYRTDTKDLFIGNEGAGNTDPTQIVTAAGYTAGQLLIGNSAGGLTKATLTAGTGISVTNGNGTITVAAVANTASVAGIVAAGTGNNNKVWKTDGSGVPAWRDDADTNTTYTAGTGLSLSGTTFNHSNSVTAGTVSEGGAARTLAYSGTFNVPSITYDAQGHITGTATTTLTLPAAGLTNFNVADNFAFKSIAVSGQSTVEADSNTDTLTLAAGSNVTITTTAASDTITIAATDTNWYPTAYAWTGGTTAGPTGSLTGTGMSAVSFAAIPSASSSASGIVTTGAQNFAGAKTFDSNVIVTGNLTVNGTTTTINSTVTTVDDPVFTVGGDTAPATDDAKDKGIEFRWHNGTAAKLGFFGYDRSTGKFTFIPDATNTSEVFSGTKGTLDANIEWTDILSKPSTFTPSAHAITSHSATAWRMFFSNATTTAVQELAFGAAGTYLRSGGTTANPTWQAVAYSEITGTPTIPTVNNGTHTISGETNVVTITTTGGAFTANKSDTTTNQITLATAYGDTKNPYGSKTANFVLAAPNGTAGVPSFRALVAADLPTHTHTNIALGDLSNVTISSVATDNLLQYNGTAWVNVAEISCGSY
jgi:hypothetical protein